MQDKSRMRVISIDLLVSLLLAELGKKKKGIRFICWGEQKLRKDIRIFKGKRFRIIIFFVVGQKKKENPPSSKRKSKCWRDK